MAKRKTKLELTWVGKDERVRLEPRVLVEDASKSYGDPSAENMLIYGDNLLALKALEQDFAGKIKCIYIDPPYNTGSAFDHFDDGLEHSLWLNLIRERLFLLWALLHPTQGSLWVSIDDREMPYLRVLMDEVCGRKNFLASNVWQKRYSRENREAVGDAHEYVLLYVRNPGQFKTLRNTLPLGKKQLKLFKNPDNDPRGKWQSVSLTAQGYRPNQMYDISGPNDKRHSPPPGSCWKVIETKYRQLLKDGRIYFGKDGTGVPRRKHFLSEAKGLVPWTWWPHEDVGHTDEAKKEIHALFGAKDAFDTPKPERLLKHILHIATDSGDLVLDSFAGSGTTGAVAQKMGRRWIMCELGEHCHTHIVPRMRKVIDGEDLGGITEAVGWKGGGGFRYYRLAESLLVRDKELSSSSRPVFIINPRYDKKMLIRGICKIEDFRYRNDGRLHGVSSESRFLHVTTRLVTQAYLDSLVEDVADGQSLLLYCTRMSRGVEVPDNVEIKRIPRDLMHKCDFQEKK